MNISIHIDHKAGIRQHKVTGPIDIEELKIFLKRLYAHPDFDPIMNAIWDLEEADFSEVSSSDVRSVIDVVRKYWGTEGKSKAALVVSKDVDYGLTRMYEILMSGVSASQVMVFKNMKEAHDWLAE